MQELAAQGLASKIWIGFKTENGEGGDGEEAEQAKLRAGLDSAIVREKSNVKCNDVAGLDSAKQALQEAAILPVKFLQFFTD
ncbi:Protein SUPPRESSOR OF K(+) TRANSPORT GROWTH DEFECT 1 [Camellia lanceoleosa]|uniref:Protein SUPPRESSOR OF K(+) TRANSPORT GROWTH DEFECT 1 n=1 Tax=Camellia lanceoleosa TaxID=1840588 RepID=A0ACC0GZF7_9ERIC|nr:Protein SUPPRESSOR OF K(+) TRANSPORT GROWTH DEFECT 1 [Camellia lanceoleosa]